MNDCKNCKWFEPKYERTDKGVVKYAPCTVPGGWTIDIVTKKCRQFAKKESGANG